MDIDSLWTFLILTAMLLMLVFTIEEQKLRRRGFAIFGLVVFLLFAAFEGAMLADLWQRGETGVLTLHALAAVLALFAWRLAVSPLARVRTKLAVAWPLGIVVGLGMLYGASDDWKRGRKLSAAVDVAADLYLSYRCLAWIARLQAQRDALRLARKQRPAAIADPAPLTARSPRC